MTTNQILTVISFFVVLFGLGMFLRQWLGRQKRRRMLMARPAKAGWAEILEKNVAIFKYLPEEYRQQLFGLMHVFLDEKRFEGCGGLEITDEIKVTVAAQACILMLNREPTFYPKLKSILVYPHAYIASNSYSGAGMFSEESARLGESWGGGTVVLAWDHVQQGVMDLRDGHNVVFHEFAHQLDQENGPADGAPDLERRSSYIAWARVMHKEYDSLCDKAEHHRRDVLNKYGTTNPAEFFAVATEAFFEKGRQLQQKHPELYAELQEYYQMDPATWLPRNNRKKRRKR